MGGRGLNSNPLATSFATRMGAKANGACYARVGTNVDDNRSMGLCGGRMERSSSTFVPARYVLGSAPMKHVGVHIW